MSFQPHILHVFPGFGQGGAELRTCDLINSFGARFRYTIVSLNGNREAVHRIHARHSIRFLSIPPHNPRNTIGNILLFSRLLRSAKPDLLVTHNWGATDWAAANALRFVCPHIHVEDGFNDDESHGQKLIRVLTRRIVLMRSYAVVVPSTTLRTIAVSQWRLGKKRVRMLANGVDMRRFSHIPVRRENPRLVIGTVGGLRRVKNQLRLLQAFAALPAQYDCELWIVGDGDQRSELEAFVKDHGLEHTVRFSGYSDKPEQYLSRMDIFCLSSDSEQMPISLLEAMASACPVVCTDVGDIRSMISPANQPYIVESMEHRPFTRALIDLITNRDLRERIGEANRERCTVVFEKHRMIDAWDRLYQEAFASRKTGTPQR